MWLTQLSHYGSYELTLLTETAEEGIKALRKEFRKANRERGAFGSTYSFQELLDGGDVRQTRMTLNKVEWL